MFKKLLVIIRAYYCTILASGKSIANGYLKSCKMEPNFHAIKVSIISFEFIKKIYHNDVKVGLQMELVVKWHARLLQATIKWK